MDFLNYLIPLMGLFVALFMLWAKDAWDTHIKRKAAISYAIFCTDIVLDSVNNSRKPLAKVISLDRLVLLLIEAKIGAIFYEPVLRLSRIWENCLNNSYSSMSNKQSVIDDLEQVKIQLKAIEADQRTLFR